MSMEHQGIKYTVVQTINPPGWKWSSERDGRSPRTGIAFNRAEAVSAAEPASSQAEISNANRGAVCVSCFDMNRVTVLGMLPLEAGVARRKCGPRKLETSRGELQESRSPPVPLQIIDSSSKPLKFPSRIRTKLSLFGR